MDESHFWRIIDDAWRSDGDLLAFRADVLGTIAPDGKDRFEKSYAEGDPTIPNERLLLEAIEQELELLSGNELIQFDRILERKLFEIDREDVHEHTDGSDDGFLYCRGFIVAMGQKYYDAVNSDPSTAMFDWECESITYISPHLYEKKFGKFPRSEICRETGTNQAGWSA